MSDVFCRPSITLTSRTMKTILDQKQRCWNSGSGAIGTEPIASMAIETALASPEIRKNSKKLTKTLARLVLFEANSIRVRQSARKRKQPWLG